MLGEHLAQRAEAFRLVRPAATMTPSRAIDGEIAEQSLQTHRMSPLLGAAFATMGAVATALQVFRSLVFHYDLLHRRQQTLALRQGSMRISITAFMRR